VATIITGARVRIVKHVTLYGISLQGHAGRVLDCGEQYATVELDNGWIVRVILVAFAAERE